MHRLNIEMQERERAQNTMPTDSLAGRGLALTRDDSERLDEVVSRIIDAQAHLERLIDELIATEQSGPVLRAISEADPPPGGPEGSEAGSGKSGLRRNPDQPLLSNRLQALLRRGTDTRDRARISTDGSSGPIEIWEQGVIEALEESGRQDLALRFDQREFLDSLRGLWSGTLETRKRLDRELGRLADFVRELQTSEDSRIEPRA